MESEVNKSLPFISTPFTKITLGIWFISASLVLGIMMHLYYLPFTDNQFFDWGFWGWLVDMTLPIILISFATGLIFKANWARVGLLYFAWLAISGSLFSLLVAIGFYDVSSLSLWHYLLLTMIFLWNIWVILYLTQREVLVQFKRDLPYLRH